LRISRTKKALKTHKGHRMATKQQPPIIPEVPTDEIDLRELFLAIWNRKWMIVGVTIIFIGIASFYNYTKPTTYQSSIILSPPSEVTVLEINKEGIFKETKDSIFRRFLEKFTAPEFQVAVLKDKGYLDQLTQDIKGDFDENQVAYGFLGSFKLVEEVKKKKGQEDSFFDPNRLEFELLGADKNLIQNYLIDLKSIANQKAIKELEVIFTSRINNELTQINEQIEDLLNIHQKEIESNKITLKEQLEIAKDLGIEENNFKKIQSNQPDSLNLSIGDNQKLPKWYLYGANALSKELDILNNRKVDSSVSQEIRKLEVRKSRLNSLVPNFKNLQLIVIDKLPNIGQPAKSKKLLIITIAGILGVMVGLILIPILNILRQEKEAT